MTDRASWWSITINNPTEEDRAALQHPPTWVKLIKCQDEIGKNGTLHIQGLANTTQVRFSSVQNWLPRAHIEIARDKKKLLNYVQKTETAVDGTQFTNAREFLTTAKALRKLAKHYVKPTEEEVFRAGDNYGVCIKRAYWAAVRQILREDEELVSLYCRPDLYRAWENTSEVWLEKVEEEEEDRQTDRQENEFVPL